MVGTLLIVFIIFFVLFKNQIFFKNETNIKEKQNKDILVEKNYQIVSPDDKTIEFLGKIYGPYVTEIDDYTNVGIIYYPLKGEEAGLASEEITFNLYLPGIYDSENILAEDIYYSVIDNIENKEEFVIESTFESSDPISNEKAFALMMNGVFEDGEFGQGFYGKTSSINNIVYSVMFSKQFFKDNNDLRKNIKLWLIENMKSYLTEIGNFAPSDEWVSYLKNNQ